MTDMEINIDEEDVNWEDGEEDGGSESDEVDVQKNVETVACTINLNPAVKGKPGSKAKRVRFTETDYDDALSFHQQALSDAVSSGVSSAGACYSPQVIHTISELLTPEWAQEHRFMLGMLSADVRNILANVGRWLKSEFRTLALGDVSVDEGRDGSSVDDVLSCVLRNRAGTCHQLNQLYCAVLCGLGGNVRYVRTIDGGSVHPADYPQIHKERWVECNPGSPVPSKARKTPPTPTVLSWVEVCVQGTRPSAAYPVKLTNEKSNADVIDLTADDDSKAIGGPINPSPVAVSESASESSRWMPVDLQHGLMDQPHAVETSLRKGRPVQFVLAFECAAPRSISNRDATASDQPLVQLVDVTATYAHVHRYSTTLEKRAKATVDAWMLQLIEQTNSSMLVQLLGTETAGDDHVVDLTDDYAGIPASSSSNGYSAIAVSSGAKRQKIAATGSYANGNGGVPSKSSSGKAPLPSRVGDLKDHPVYLLERHLLSEQALHPTAKSVALFKGESVYLQAHKETLRTKLQWRRQLRQVRRDEEPIRVVKRHVISHNRDGGQAGGGQGAEESKVLELKLFGVWQTEPIQVNKRALICLVARCFILRAVTAPLDTAHNRRRDTSQQIWEH
jgi:hypothetical protein